MRLRRPFDPPQTTEAETLENAVAMVERLQGLYLRTKKIKAGISWDFYLFLDSGSWG